MIFPCNLSKEVEEKLKNLHLYYYIHLLSYIKFAGVKRVYSSQFVILNFNFSNYNLSVFNLNILLRQAPVEHKLAMHIK